MVSFEEDEEDDNNDEEEEEDDDEEEGRGTGSKVPERKKLGANNFPLNTQWSSSAERQDPNRQERDHDVPSRKGSKPASPANQSALALKMPRIQNRQIPSVAVSSTR